MLDRARLFTSAPAFAVSLALVVSAASACSKTEGQSSGTATATTTAPAPSGSVAAAAPDASPVAADTTTGNTPVGGADATAPSGTAASAGADAGAAGAAGAASAGGAIAKNAGAAAASASAGPLECGTKPLPDCPLQAWMKANTNPPIAANDLPALAAALEKTASFAPAGYTNWVAVSKDGAKAARGGDMTAAKASCRTCHDQYKDKYKKEMRARKL